jgi:protein-disulfide isomerase
MTLSSESKFLLGILGATAVIVAIAAFAFSRPAPPPPTIPQDQLVTTVAARKGNPDAKAVLVEFSDFQCSACLAAKPYVDALVTKYPNDLLFVYRHFPLDQHEQALPSAYGAEAAKQQGKFWEMYDGLFTNQETLSEQTIVRLAQELDLRMEAFHADRASASIAAIVEKDRTDALSFGLNSTPTFFLNGQKLTLYSFADLEKAVADAIAK